MVAALAAAIESPQVPPEARERIRSFLKLYRAGAAAIDTTRPDLYVHRLIDRLGLRRQQLFAAQADVVERLRALARFGELAAAFVRRVAAGDAARVCALDRRRRGLRAARAGGARAVGRARGAGGDARVGRRARGRSRVRARPARRACAARVAGGSRRAAAGGAAARRRGEPSLGPAPDAVRRDDPRSLPAGAGVSARERPRSAAAAVPAARARARRRRRKMGGPGGGAVRPGRDAALHLPAPARRAARVDDARGRPAGRAALRHRPRRLACRRALPGAAQARGD